MLLATIAVLVVLALAIIVGASVGTARFRNRFQAEKAGLIRRVRATRSEVVDATEVSALPSPVRKYLETTRGVREPVLRIATLRQTGTLRTAADKPWMPFEAEQIYSADPPGFLWLARARVAPFVYIMARDKFVDGKGNMLIRLLGLVTVADGHGPEMDQGAGLRHWGEIIAFPEPVRSRHLRWEPIDDHRARFIAEHDGLRVAATVEFDSAGLPIATHAERFRDVVGKPVLTEWSGYFRDWKGIDGRLFPSRWESVWHLPQGDFTAVKLEIHGIKTE